MFTQKVSNSVIDFIETYHTVIGEFPRRAQIMDAVRIATGDEPDPSELDSLLDDPNFNKSLDERGIIPPWTLYTNASGITQEQLAIVAILTNPKDRRSDAKKLGDLGISTRKYNGWISDKRFVSYMKRVANNLLENVEADAHLALLRQVQSGSMSGIKLYFEMTGRWNPAHESEVNHQVLMTRFIDIITRHVHDPAMLSSIAADLQLAAVELGAIPQGNQRTAIEPASELRVLPVGDTKFNEPTRKLTF